jgi:hypothetical protein
MSMPLSRFFPLIAIFPAFLEPEIPGWDTGSARLQLSSAFDRESVIP